MQEFGIKAIGLAIPQYYLPLSELANIRNCSAEQYTETLGCKKMALCGPDENVVSLAITASQRALAHWGQPLDNLGLIISATETAVDMSRPLSSWIMESLKLKGNIRSYEVKHACYGGTAAIRQALEWKLSGNSKGKAALVVASDVALYAEAHSGEPTQGAGAVALIIDDAAIASIDTISYYWSDPQFDFWRPVGKQFPEVNGRLSLSCYINAVNQCFTQLAPKTELPTNLNEYEFIAFHVPFAKMVQKAVKHLGIESLYDAKIMPSMEWNQQIGNSYTASLWFAVANVLTKTKAKDQFLAFSYGSGCGAELLKLQATSNQRGAAWAAELENDLAKRQAIDINTYQEFRKHYLREKQ